MEKELKNHVGNPKIWRPELKRMEKPSEPIPSCYLSKTYGFKDVSVQNPQITAPKWTIYTRKDSQLYTRTDDGVYVSLEDGKKFVEKYRIMVDEKKVTLESLADLIQEAKKVEHHSYKPDKGMIIAAIQKDGLIGLIWAKIIQFDYKTGTQASKDTNVAENTPIAKKKRK